MPKKKNPDTILTVPLSRERVLLAALRLDDAEGLEALSMRNLAQELGVKAMSLYNHVKNKDDLILVLHRFV
jgi:AcrR family transcriptional regulator